MHTHCRQEQTPTQANIQKITTKTTPTSIDTASPDTHTHNTAAAPHRIINKVAPTFRATEPRDRTHTRRVRGSLYKQRMVWLLFVARELYRGATYHGRNANDTHTHTHTHIKANPMCVCMCVRNCMFSLLAIIIVSSFCVKLLICADHTVRGSRRIADTSRIRPDQRRGANQQRHRDIVHMLWISNYILTRRVKLFIHLGVMLMLPWDHQLL